MWTFIREIPDETYGAACDGAENKGTYFYERKAARLDRLLCLALFGRHRLSVSSNARGLQPVVGALVGMGTLGISRG